MKIAASATQRHCLAYRLTVLSALAISASVGCDKKSDAPQPTTAPAQTAAVQTALERARASAGAFAPLPEHWARPDQTEAQEALGRILYYEPRLSKSQELSCNSCHLLDKYGVDSAPTSTGHNKALGTRNSPTVYNAAGHFRQFWDGRAADVEEQAKGPVLNPVEMAMLDEAHVIRLINSIPGYEALFKEAFPEDLTPISYDNIAKAIGAFERKLVTPSRWDKFLKGDDTALSEEELEGFNRFAASGCMACHNGALVGGTTYQQVGSVKPWPNQDDQGRFEVTQDPNDKMMFKAPSLRNVAMTAPYFHDGSVKELSEAVKVMGTYQLGATISDEDARLITTWLGTLTGEIDQAYIAKPELPEGGPDTPGPDLN